MKPDYITEERWNWWLNYKTFMKNHYATRLPMNQVEAFMKYFETKYDKFATPYICPKLALQLYTDYHYCKKIGTRWYACVGPGGTGKSTLMSNVFYFLDDSFSMADASLDTKGFLKALELHDNPDEQKALFMDEPDDDIHPQTAKGKILRKVLGKARQGKFFFGICATDMTDIPPYLFRKMDAIIFTPNLGEYMLFRDNPMKREYVTQLIRKSYLDGKGYRVFFDLEKQGMCVKGATYKHMPFSTSVRSKYLKNKWDDYRNDIKALNEMIEKEKNGGKKKDENVITKEDIQKEVDDVKPKPQKKVNTQDMVRQYYFDIIEKHILGPDKMSREAIAKKYDLTLGNIGRYYAIYKALKGNENETTQNQNSSALS